MPYSLGTDRLEKMDLEKIKSKLSEDEERKLTTDMRELYDRLLPTDAIEKNRQKLVQKLETLFNEEWPGHDIRVHLFGSSGNLLCSDDSDGEFALPFPLLAEIECGKEQQLEAGSYTWLTFSSGYLYYD